MAIQFLRGTTNAINASTQTLKPGQPLLNMDTGCLYLNSTDDGTVNGTHSFQYPSLKTPSYRTIELVLDSMGIEYGTSPNLGTTAVYYLDVNLGMNEIPKGTLFVNYSSNNSWFNESGFKYFDQITELHLRYSFAVPGKTFYTYIHLYNIALPETTSAGWFEIDLPENLNPALQKDQSIIGVFKGYRTTFPETTPPLVYNGSSIVVDNALYAYRDTANNFSAKQTFSGGINVKDQSGSFSITPTRDWINYGTQASGGAETLSKLVLNDYYALPTLNDYRVLATERPVNSTAVRIPQSNWTQVTKHSNAWTASGPISGDVPTELFGLADSKLKIELDLTVKSILVSSGSHTAYLAFYKDYVTSGSPNVLTAALDQVSVEPSVSTTYSGWVPAYWIAPAESDKKSMTMALISVKINTAGSSPITTAYFYIQTTNFYQPPTQN